MEEPPFGCPNIEEIYRMAEQLRKSRQVRHKNRLPVEDQQKPVEIKIIDRTVTPRRKHLRD